jgi:hypothetical protein
MHLVRLDTLDDVSGLVKRTREKLDDLHLLFLLLAG